MNTDITIQTKKLELIQWLATVEDLSVINKILDLKSKENDDWWNKILETEKESILKGLEDADSGHLKPHIIAREVYEKWL